VADHDHLGRILRQLGAKRSFLIRRRHVRIRDPRLRAGERNVGAGERDVLAFTRRHDRTNEERQRPEADLAGVDALLRREVEAAHGNGVVLGLEGQRVARRHERDRRQLGHALRRHGVLDVAAEANAKVGGPPARRIAGDAQGDVAQLAEVERLRVRGDHRHRETLAVVAAPDEAPRLCRGLQLDQHLRRRRAVRQLSVR
jgi:hypothetical protein